MKDSLKRIKNLPIKEGEKVRASAIPPKMARSGAEHKRIMRDKLLGKYEKEFLRPAVLEHENSTKTRQLARIEKSLNALETTPDEAPVWSPTGCFIYLLSAVKEIVDAIDSIESRIDKLEAHNGPKDSTGQ